MSSPLPSEKPRKAGDATERSACADRHGISRIAPNDIRTDMPHVLSIGVSPQSDPATRAVTASITAPVSNMRPSKDPTAAPTAARSVGNSPAKPPSTTLGEVALAG